MVDGTNSTYFKHAAICAKFYELAFDSKAVANFLLQKLSIKPNDKVLFVGGMFAVANELSKHNIDLTVVDYSQDMVNFAKAKYLDMKVSTADLMTLPFNNTSDKVIVPGRVFTHLLTDGDIHSGLTSCLNSLKPGGVCFFDNYESDKISVTDYFNGFLTFEDSESKIARTSTTVLISSNPYIVNWKARYQGEFLGEKFDFEDNILHRAWSRKEALQFTEAAGFGSVLQEDNFDETSFCSVAVKH